MGLHQAIEAKEQLEGSEREHDAGDDYVPELFPDVSQAGGYDRYSEDGRRRVQENLRA